MTAQPRAVKLGLVLTLFLVATFCFANVKQANANGSYSVNTMANPGFESGLSQWVVDTFNDGNGGSSITANNTLAVTGYYSARFDISANRTANNPAHPPPLTFGKITLYQAVTSNTYFANMTNRPDDLNLWLYVQPKFAGFSSMEIRIKATDTTELDYFYANPVLKINLQNSTRGGEGGKPVKMIAMPTPQYNTWIHFERNLGQDWLAPMTNADGVSGRTAPGFNATEQIVFVMLEAGISADSTGGWYGETTWVDNVALYIDSTTPPPPPPPTNYYAAFRFEDLNGNPVDNLVQWKLFNSTGNEVAGYVQNTADLQLEPYTVNVYYPNITSQNPEPYLIRSQRIQLNTTIAIPLEMFPQPAPWSYVAFNNTITNMKIIKENLTTLQFNSQGTAGPILILVKVQTKPIVVQRNLDDPSSLAWNYDSSRHILRIPTLEPGNFSIFLLGPITVPSLTFQDANGNQVTTGLSWKIFNPDGTQVQAVPGQLIENLPYLFQGFYNGYPIYSSTLTSIPNPVRLEMFPILTQQNGYIAFNTTVSTLSILQNSSAQLQFRTSGQGSHLIVISSATKPLSVQLDGNTLQGWTYNSTTSTIAIQSSQLGTFTITYSNGDTIPLYLIGAILGAVAVIAAGVFFGQRIRRKNQIQNASEVDPLKAKERNKPKEENRNTRKGRQ